MIKFSGTTETGKVFGFGLSGLNVEMLKQSRPISVDLTPLGSPGNRVVIFFGQTEADMYEELKKLQAIGPDTPLHEQEDLHEET